MHSSFCNRIFQFFFIFSKSSSFCNIDALLVSVTSFGHCVISSLQLSYSISLPFPCSFNVHIHHLRRYSFGSFPPASRVFSFSVVLHFPFPCVLPVDLASHIIYTSQLWSSSSRSVAISLFPWSLLQATITIYLYSSCPTKSNLNHHHYFSVFVLSIKVQSQPPSLFLCIRPIQQSPISTTITISLYSSYPSKSNLNHHHYFSVFVLSNKVQSQPPSLFLRIRPVRQCPISTTITISLYSSYPSHSNLNHHHYFSVFVLSVNVQSQPPSLFLCIRPVRQCPISTTITISPYSSCPSMSNLNHHHYFSVFVLSVNVQSQPPSLFLCIRPVRQCPISTTVTISLYSSCPSKSNLNHHHYFSLFVLSITFQSQPPSLFLRIRPVRQCPISTTITISLYSSCPSMSNLNHRHYFSVFVLSITVQSQPPSLFLRIRPVCQCPISTTITISPYSFCPSMSTPKYHHSQVFAPALINLS